MKKYILSCTHCMKMILLLLLPHQVADVVKCPCCGSKKITLTEKGASR